MEGRKLPNIYVLSSIQSQPVDRRYSDEPDSGSLDSPAAIPDTRSRSLTTEEQRTTYGTQYGLSRLSFVLHSWFEVVPNSFRQRPTPQPPVVRPQRPGTRVFERSPTCMQFFPHPSGPPTHKRIFVFHDVCFIRWLAQHHPSNVRYYS